MEWWEALQEGRDLKPYPWPPSPRGSPPWSGPPWCWRDPVQQLVSEGQSPQARRWLATGGQGWQEEEEEEEEEGVEEEEEQVALALVQPVKVVQGGGAVGKGEVAVK